eukprot:scaffold150960_cov33-Tisochrysis_lutea.AAC.3
MAAWTRSACRGSKFRIGTMWREAARLLTAATRPPTRPRCANDTSPPSVASRADCALLLLPRECRFPQLALRKKLSGHA